MVAAGLCTSKRKDDVAIVMLPADTANDQGKSFGLEAAPEALERNIDVIRAAHETQLQEMLEEMGLEHRQRHAGAAATGHCGRTARAAGTLALCVSGNVVRPARSREPSPA